jgi:hypothetical protein
MQPSRLRFNQRLGKSSNQVAFLPLLCRKASGCSLHAAVTGQAMVGPPRGKRLPDEPSTATQ